MRSHAFTPIIENHITIQSDDTEAQIWAKLKRHHRDYQDMLTNDENSERSSSIIDKTDGRRSITISDNEAIVFAMPENAAVERIIRYNLSFVTKRLIHALGKKHRLKANNLISLLEVIVNKMQEAHNLDAATQAPNENGNLTTTLSAFLPQHDIKVISLIRLPAHTVTKEATLAHLEEARLWIDTLQEKTDALFEQWDHCPNASTHYAMRSLLYTLAGFKIISSGCNMFMSSTAIGALFQYTEGSANLCSTALTRAPKMLKFDRGELSETPCFLHTSPNIHSDFGHRTIV